MVSYAYQQAAAERERVLEKQIRRFAKTYQRRLRKLVKTSSRLGDLLYSFPAAAFAIVSGYGDHNRRGDAVRLVKDGASLKMVAGALELPLWTRRLPPEAFVRELQDLPDGPDFNRKIANLIPKDPEAATMWLAWLQAARTGCDDDFALWLASQKIYASGWHCGQAPTPVLPLATFAWFSSRGDRPARRLMETPWHRKMGLGAAIKGMAGWFERVLLDLTRADAKRGPGRYSKRRAGSQYNLVPLVTARELYEEGEAMNHCGATYALAVAQGHCMIFSVRRFERGLRRWKYAGRGIGGRGRISTSSSVIRIRRWTAMSIWLSAIGWRKIKIWFARPVLPASVTISTKHAGARCGPIISPIKASKPSCRSARMVYS